MRRVATYFIKRRARARTASRLQFLAVLHVRSIVSSLIQTRTPAADVQRGPSAAAAAAAPPLSARQAPTAGAD